MAECLTCGRPLPARTGRGRPLQYCGAGCRRGAEFEIRRIDRHIAGLEKHLSWLRRTDPRFRMEDDADLRRLEAEIALQRARFGALLNGTKAKEVA